MAFFWGRFNPIETVDPELKELYRIRDNDEIYKNNKALLVNTSSLYNNNVDNFKNLAVRFTSRPNDPIWLGMTEEERVENGLRTRASLIQHSVYGFWAFLTCGVISTLLYSRIYYPGGIILRNQRKEGVVGYLVKRLPLTLMFAYCFYSASGLRMKYLIDYYSESEDEIDNELKSRIKA